MKAIAIHPGTRSVYLTTRPEPQIEAPDQIKLRVLSVGICGTDREEADGGRADAPEGATELVIGHELLGQVAEVGKAVTRVQPGDLAVFTVRRGCGECDPCAINRSDMCTTGRYRERGIKGLDGYQTEYVVDSEQYIVRIPADIGALGVLTEPLSIVEKAIDDAVRLQFARLPAALATPDWLFGRNCLVAGLGPVGLLAALALTLRGAKVCGLDIVPGDSARPTWLRDIGGNYINGHDVQPDQIRREHGPMQLLFEATGVPALAFNLLDALDYNGIYVLTGIPGNSRTIALPAAELLRDLVLDNQLMIGSVNAARGHFQLAVNDLERAEHRWPGLMERLITQRCPPEEAESLLEHHPADEIKATVEWAKPSSAASESASTVASHHAGPNIAPPAGPHT
jgi:threonine dehydrogenase-like Zn-dependent dehydrogenase